MSLTKQDIELIKTVVDGSVDRGIEGLARIVKTGFDAVDQRFEAMDQRFEAVDQRFNAMDLRFDAMDQRFDAMDLRFDAMDLRFEGIDVSLVEIKADRRTDSGVTREHSADLAELKAKAHTH